MQELEQSAPFISVVSPVYPADQTIGTLCSQLLDELSKITAAFEIILVDDGSQDMSWSMIVDACKGDKRIKGIRLSKNFGQHHAITAGLDQASGMWIVVMDCDLQDKPSEIIKLYNQAINGYDIVFARRAKRKDVFIKRFVSRIFYVLFSYLTNIHQDGTISNFGIYSRSVISSINSMREPLRAFSPMVRWVGFNKIAIDVEHGPRLQGKSTYNWGKLLNLGLYIAISYSDKPLKLVIKIGLVMSIASFTVAIFSVVAYSQGIIKLTGFTSLIVSIWFLSGLIIFILGIIGLYIGKIFEGIKQRPLYIINQTSNIN